MNYWTRANIYAEQYAATTNFADYNAAIKSILDEKYHQEAGVAWAAIDQYAGTHRRSQ